ncbi:MAG: transcriptional regulator, partial [Peptoniphilus sp.]|uniref:transcriptional regulator n=1 Tax=Peptoniphilus sp. TaxID=1971214 RepID=UPI002A75E7D6
NEIAETLNITKQAVSDNIKRAAQNLEHYEKILGLLENYNKSIARKKKLLNLLENLKNSSTDLNLEILNDIISLINDEEVQNGI